MDVFLSGTVHRLAHWRVNHEHEAITIYNNSKHMFCILFLYFAT